MPSDKMNQQKNNANNQTPEEQQNLTITPAMLDKEGDEEVVKRQDISKIIPTTPTNLENTTSIVLTSKDKELKTDGAVVLGILRSEDLAEPIADATLPEPIDIAKRKEEIKKNINKKQQKKEPGRKIKTKEQIMQNKMSLLALVVIAIIVGTGLYIYLKPTALDFQALNITVELGIDSVPKETEVKKFVKPGLGESIDERAYKIDLSNVEIDSVGDYEYTVTFQGQIKTGIISIVDTTGPELTMRDRRVTEGELFAPEEFIEDCFDWSKCNEYNFEDKNATKNYTEPGDYDIRISATDTYNNKTIAKGKLTILASDNVRRYKKSIPYDATTGYSLEYYYKIDYTDIFGSARILDGIYKEIYTYQDEIKWNEAKVNYNGVEFYTIDEAKKQIILEKKINIVGPSLDEKYAINDYLISQGYSGA